MAEKLMKEDFDDVYDDYFDLIYRIAFIHIKKPDDSNEIVQEVLLKYLFTKKTFSTEEQKKAWIIKTAHDASMDYFRTKMRKTIRIQDLAQMHIPFAVDKTLEVLLMMPDKYRTPFYLNYCEGYSADEIASILHKSKSSMNRTIKSGKEYLEKKLGGAV